MGRQTGREFPAPKQTSGFRHQLRLATHSSHDQTETLFAPFQADMTGRLGWFLAAQRSGLGALAQGLPADDPARILPDRLCRILDADLAALDQPWTPLPAPVSCDPLAVRYIVLGSRLGTELLRRRLAQHLPDTRIPGYFAPADHGRAWSTLCAELDAIDPASEQALRLIDQACTAFDLFRRAALAQPHPTGAPDHAAIA
ncbi:biliverdin-producing heme oxygenase [Pseudooceanicola sp. CBS1P-1]|uniref:Heme oxygenase n=1 Tax=Pseudooceanicola albus TaxID=2692189 RepID=A0A6L7G8W1_9RHOB|nr:MULTISPECIES: biliverdin-producing heme oxygenase [Pseudooceanicola]MBT9386471.1 biliverdin-producing heme oxygenase [Pseudooceanicola endophyticus]MXN20505.1 hypothetical protein [Pseudooceanicola albus]